MSDLGGFGPSAVCAAGGLPSEQLPVDLSVLYNTMAVIALSVTRLFSRLSSPSTPLCGDPHALRKLVRSSSTTGHGTKTGANADSLAGAWRKMLLLDGVESDFPARSTCPALCSSSASAPQRGGLLVSHTAQVSSKKNTLMCLHMDGADGTDTFSLPTSPIHTPGRGRSCSPQPRPSLSWVTLPCPEPPHSAMDANSSPISSLHQLNYQACTLHTSATPTHTSSAGASAAVLQSANRAAQPSDLVLACGDPLCIVQSSALAVPTSPESTALAASVLVEVRSMLRAMGAYPAKGMVLPSSPTAQATNSLRTGSTSSPSSTLSTLPLYNASLSSQLGSGPAVGRGGFGSVYSGVWEGEEVAIKRVPFNAIQAQRSAPTGSAQPNTIACCAAKAAQGWRLPNGILMECAHGIVLGGGCSSVCFDGIVQLRCWAISPLAVPPYDSGTHPSNDTNTHELLLVMPLLRRSLDQALQQHLSLQHALMAAHDVASAVLGLHTRNVVHGDLKCANAMQAADGPWLLLDFGLAATLKGKMQSAAARGSSQGHAAPELLGDGRISTATDVYAVGVMLTRVLTHKSVMRGAPSWWAAAVTAAGASKFSNSEQAGEVCIQVSPIAECVSAAAGRVAEGVAVMVHLLQLLQRAQAEQPAARPSMQQLCTAIQAATDSVTTLSAVSNAPGCGPHRSDSSPCALGDERILSACSKGEVRAGQDGCSSSSPTFSTITTDPAWSSSTTESDADDDVDTEEEEDTVEAVPSSSGQSR